MEEKRKVTSESSVKSLTRPLEVGASRRSATCCATDVDNTGELTAKAKRRKKKFGGHNEMGSEDANEEKEGSSAHLLNFDPKLYSHRYLLGTIEHDRPIWLRVALHRIVRIKTPL